MRGDDVLESAYRRYRESSCSQTPPRGLSLHNSNGLRTPTATPSSSTRNSHAFPGFELEVQAATVQRLLAVQLLVAVRLLVTIQHLCLSLRDLFVVQAVAVHLLIPYASVHIVDHLVDSGLTDDEALGERAGL